MCFFLSCSRQVLAWKFWVDSQCNATRSQRGKNKNMHAHWWEKVEVWILKGEKSHSNSIALPFLLFLEDVWILKSACSLKTRTHACHNQHWLSKLQKWKFVWDEFDKTNRGVGQGCRWGSARPWMPPLERVKSRDSRKTAATLTTSLTHPKPVTPSTTRLSLVSVPVLSKQQMSILPANGILNGSVQYTSETDTNDSMQGQRWTGVKILKLSW